MPLGILYTCAGDESSDDVVVVVVVISDKAYSRESLRGDRWGISEGWVFGSLGDVSLPVADSMQDCGSSEALKSDVGKDVDSDDGVMLLGGVDLLLDIVRYVDSEDGIMRLGGVDLLRGIVRYADSGDDMMLLGGVDLLLDIIRDVDAEGDMMLLGGVDLLLDISNAAASELPILEDGCTRLLSTGAEIMAAENSGVLRRKLLQESRLSFFPIFFASLSF